MEYTRYFSEQVLRKRPYIKEVWLKLALNNPIKVEKQSDDRIRYFVYIEEINKYLRVVTLSDGVTIHNAFPDRDFDI